jgi:O-antigen/teichoic acid export membrane protein
LSHLEIARRSTRGSFALFAGNFLTAAISFVAITIIARLLGPSQYGVYTLAILVPNIMLNFLGFGINSGITRFAAYELSQGRPEVAKRMTLNGASFILIFGAVLSAVTFASAGFLAGFVLNRPEIASDVQFASLLILGQAVFQSGVSSLLGWSLMGDISLTNVSQATLRLVVAVPLVVLGFAVFGALAGYFVSVALGGALAFVLLLRKSTGIGVKPLEGLATDVRTMLFYGWRLFVGQFATSISAQYVVVILAAIAPNNLVGYYQSANNFVTAITLSSGAITQSLFPAFAHLEGTRADLSRAFAFASKYMAFALAPVIFLLMGASVQIIGVPLGPSYSLAASYLVLLAFANVSLILGHGVLPSFFNGVGRPKFYMIFSLAGAGVLAVLAPLLGIWLGLGVVGLIYAVLASNLVAVSTGLYLSSKVFSARLDLPATASILASSVLAFVAILPIEMSHFNSLGLLVLEVAVFAAVYLTAAPLLGAIGPQDLEILSSALAGLGRFKSLILPIVAYERLVIRLSGRA